MLWFTRRLLGLKKYVPLDVPQEYPLLTSSVFWDFTFGSFRAVFYYFAVTAICGLSRLVDEMGEALVASLQEAERTEGVEKDDLKVQVDASYDEVYRLSTLVMHGIFKNREEEIQQELDKFRSDATTPVPNRAEDEEYSDYSEYSGDEASGVPGGQDSVDPEELEEGEEFEESVEEVTTQSSRKKQPFVFRMFNRYVTEHNIPTPRIFWLKLKKNNLLFVYELIYFINHNLLDILRLINIGMMTVACAPHSPPLTRRRYGQLRLAAEHHSHHSADLQPQVVHGGAVHRRDPVHPALPRVRTVHLPRQGGAGAVLPPGLH